MKKKDINGVKVDSCPDLFEQQIVRRFVSRRAIPQGFSSTCGIVNSICHAFCISPLEPTLYLNKKG